MIWPFYRADEGQIVDTWTTMGMRGTGSHDTVADGVFVPHVRTAQPRPLADPPSDYGGPIYRMTVWVPVAVLAAPALGIAQAALDLVLDLGSTKRPNYLTQTMGERPVTQSQVAEAAAMIDAARSHLHNSLATAFESVQAGALINQEHKIRVQLATTFAVRTAADAVDLLCRAAGTTSIEQSSLLEKHFRDIQVIARHAYSSTARYESVGKLLFGQESDWGFFAL
jgi:alkylation response protein AidB-like acyl-CoA dehydrogenase